MRESRVEHLLRCSATDGGGLDRRDVLRAPPARGVSSVAVGQRVGRPHLIIMPRGPIGTCKTTTNIKPPRTHDTFN